MNEILQIDEVVSTTSEYTEILTLIHNLLVETNQNVELLTISILFACGILSGVIAGAICSYFIGQILKTR